MLRVKDKNKMENKNIEKKILDIFTKYPNKIFTTGQIVKIIKRKWMLTNQILIKLDRGNKINSTFYDDSDYWGNKGIVLEFRKKINEIESKYLYLGEDIYMWDSDKFLKEIILDEILNITEGEMNDK